MIKELNRTCEKVNNAFGVSIKLPEPKKNTLKAFSTLNFVVGVGLVASSVLLSNKWCALIGVLSIVSGIVQRHESKIIK